MNARVRALVSRIIDLIRDYKTKQSIDDDASNLAVEATTVGLQFFETIQSSKQNTDWSTSVRGVPRVSKSKTSAWMDANPQSERVTKPRVLITTV